MNKTIFFSIVAVATFFLSTQTFSLEARECRHCHPRSNVRVNVGTGYQNPGNYTVRRYARPVPSPVVYTVVRDPYAPVYYEPAYPVYVEEVYVAPARPSIFSGLSFSWNFFR